MWSHRFPFKMNKSVIVLCCPSLNYIVQQIKFTLNERLYYSTALMMAVLFVKIYNLLHILHFIQFIIILNIICVIKSHLFQSLNLNSNWHVMLIKKIFIEYGYKMIQYEVNHRIKVTGRVRIRTHCVIDTTTPGFDACFTDSSKHSFKLRQYNNK